jgi:hypothetical protein
MNHEKRPLPRLLQFAGIVACSAGMLLNAAAQTQIGDFRLTSGLYSGAFTYFDPGFGPHTTRAVIGAPVQVNSVFIGTSQNPGDPPPSTTDDIGLQTYSSSTVIRTLNRFASSLNGGTTGVDRAGAVQWSFNLSPLDSYLAGNDLLATALTLSLPLTTSDAARKVDVYLSYTSTGITKTGISTTSGQANYHDLWWPAQASSEENIVDGKFQILKLGAAGPLELSTSLLDLYDSGVREFNVILASGDFWSSRNIFVPEGSGLFLTTAPVPEPSTTALMLLGLLGAAALRRGHGKDR